MCSFSGNYYLALQKQTKKQGDVNSYDTSYMGH